MMSEEAAQSPSLNEVIADYQEAPEPAPEAPSVSPPEPTLSPESVVSDERAPEAPLPDSTLIADRVSRLTGREDAIEKRRAQEQEYADLKEEVRLLRMMRGGDFQREADKVEDRIDAADDEQSTLMKELKKELETMRAGQERMKAELQNRQKEAELMEAQNEYVNWVKEQKEHFPLLNAIGQQQLGFQKMLNEQQRTGQVVSEVQATREVEAELRGIVDLCAPLLGYTRLSERESSREESVSVGSSGMAVGDPVDVSKMNPDDALNAIISDYEKHQR